jgi:AraC family transcriptional regulator, regulatory protein of adaptative response / methylphosphotriester-DNA alkyltransferase methyltransferase
MHISREKLMEKSDQISDNEKWCAVVSCDKAYDGQFFYGVETTGIFCHPSCKAKTPLRANVIFFANADNAVKAGFRPCKKCRPDLLLFEPDRELVKKAKSILDMHYNSPEKLQPLSKELGVSTSHLIRLFKQHYGLTPAHYITGLRIEKAVELLGQGGINILEIAYKSGFKSVSNFYRCFKEHMGHTPKEYRKSTMCL